MKPPLSKMEHTDPHELPEEVEDKTQTEIWEEEHLRVLSKCSPELLKITGKHSTLWNYSKLETMEKLASLLTTAREQGAEAERDNFMEWLPEMLGMQTIYELEKVEKMVEKAIEDELDAEVDSI